MLANNEPAFAAAYGATNLVFGLYAGMLQPGQLLTLLQPASGSSNTVVTEVEFDSVRPLADECRRHGQFLAIDGRAAG